MAVTLASILALICLVACLFAAFGVNPFKARKAWLRKSPTCREVGFSRLTVVVVLFPLLLITLKSAEIWGEPCSPAESMSKHLKLGDGFSPEDAKKARDDIKNRWSWADTLGTAVVRRLDDAVFWLAVALASTISALHGLAHHLGEDCTECVTTHPTQKPLRYTFWVLAASVLVAYGVANYFQKEAIFWWVGDHKSDCDQQWSTKGLVWATAIQFVEGIGTLVVLFTSYFTAAAGFAAADKIRSAWSDDEGNRPAAHRHAKVLVRACVLPFVAVNLFFAAYKLLVTELGVTAYPSSTLPGRVFGLTVIISLPYMLVLCYCAFTWPLPLRSALTILPKSMKLD